MWATQHEPLPELDSGLLCQVSQWVLKAARVRPEESSRSWVAESADWRVEELSCIICWKYTFLKTTFAYVGAIRASIYRLYRFFTVMRSSLLWRSIAAAEATSNLWWEESSAQQAGQLFTCFSLSMLNPLNWYPHGGQNMWLKADSRTDRDGKPRKTGRTTSGWVLSSHRVRIKYAVWCTNKGSQFNLQVFAPFLKINKPSHPHRCLFHPDGLRSGFWEYL